jgi:hypothetical protein
VETRSPERAKLSEELAVLNRPLEGEVEYYDEAPRWRATWVFAAVLLLAAIGCAGYLLLARGHRADDGAAGSGAVVPAKAPASEAVSARPEPEPESDPPAPSAGAARFARTR